MNKELSEIVKEKAPAIKAEISKAQNVLLHCHPSPDPDSVGSTLAMKFALEGMGKKVTVIQGDSEIPLAFMHFPGATEIIKKNYFEINPNEFDLLFVLDSARTGVSRLGEVTFPESMTVINIDHHRTNQGCGKINLIHHGVSSCAEVMFALLKEMNVTITPEIAQNIFVGMYTDSGGFKYEGTTSATLKSASELASIATNFPELIKKMENSNIPQTIFFKGLAFNSIKVFLGGKFAVSKVDYDALKKHDLVGYQLVLHDVSAAMNNVIGWNFSAAMVENEPNKIKISFRSQDPEKFDVSLLAATIGGGGHKAASGATLDMSLVDAEKLVVEKAKSLYNL